MSPLLLSFIAILGDLSNSDILKNSTLVHSVDDIVLIRPGNQEVTSILNALSEHMYTRKWEINSMNIQENSIYITFIVRVTGSQSHGDIPL